jgi:Na+-transporting methylmalonyl-CoA/oxaloacetate decarboxylase gamma subunit
MGVLNAVAMFALSETIKLFVDIEEHTRETRRLMEKLEENTHATAVILHHRQSKSE